MGEAKFGAPTKRKRKVLLDERKHNSSFETVRLQRSIQFKSEAPIADTCEGKQNNDKHSQPNQEMEVIEKDEPMALTLKKGDGKPWRFPAELQTNVKGALRIGTSGYVYRHWKKIVYPNTLSQKRWFEHYTFLFDTVEINNTFYRLPASTVFENWHKQAPSGFSYALKFSRFGTHLKRLKDPDGPISLFLERAQALEPFHGPILVQLPPSFNLNLERLKLFLNKAPRSYRWAIEVRDSSWLCDEVYSLLNIHNASLVIHDHEDIPFRHPKIITADWIYLRFHGHNYTQCYSPAQLRDHASWIKEQLSKGIDVYAYFNNDACGYAALNALDLRDMIIDSCKVEPITEAGLA